MPGPIRNSFTPLAHLPASPCLLIGIAPGRRHPEQREGARSARACPECNEGC